MLDCTVLPRKQDGPLTVIPVHHVALSLHSAMVQPYLTVNRESLFLYTLMLEVCTTAKVCKLAR